MEHIITAPVDAKIETFEATLAHIGDNAVSSGNKLIFDLTDCEFLDPRCYAYLFSLLAVRKKKEKVTQYRLPISGKVRQSMALWEFDEAIEKETGAAFDDVISPDSKVQKLVLSDEPIHYSPIIRDEKNYSKGYTIKRSRNFLNFRLLSILSQDGSKRNPELILREFRENWEGAIIKELFDIHFKSEEYFVSHIFWEIITNAFRHPDADSLTFMSVLEKDKNHDPKSIVFSFWDNGQWMHETLDKALHSGKKIRHEKASKNVNVEFLIDNDQNLPNSFQQNNIAEKSLHISKTIRKNTRTKSEIRDEKQVLLSCLMPGITRDVYGNDRPTRPDSVSVDIDSALPGMGFFNLLNYTCHMSGGVVSIRTGRVLVHISGNEEKTDAKNKKYVFNASFNNLESDDPSCELMSHFGNMIMVEIPISPKN